MQPGLLVGQSVRLVRPLGAGGMGCVWLADHLALKTPVVVKFMIDSVAATQESRDRFSREAITASQVKTPHVVQTLDHGVTPEGVPYIVMELLEGTDLAHRLRNGPLSLRETASMIRQVSRALSRAHGVGIVHRDIKPDNIFLCDVGAEEPFVKLLDFGIAKASQAGSLENKTRTGAMMGTPYYMSPEQFVGDKGVDARSDLWSLGVVAYECVTGARPFEADTLGGLALAVHTGPIVPPCRVRPDLPAALDAWFARACARGPADRFQSAKDLADAFEAAAAPAGMAASAVGATPPQEATAPPASPPAPQLLVSTGGASALEAEVDSSALPAGVPKRRSPLVYGVVALAALVLVGGVGALLASGRSEQSGAAAAAASTTSTPGPTRQESPDPTTETLAQLPSDPARPDAATAAPPETRSSRPAPPRPGSAPQAVRPGSGPATPPPSPAPSPARPATRAAPDCNPPFTIDQNGVKHPKMECL